MGDTRIARVGLWAGEAILVDGRSKLQDTATRQDTRTVEAGMSMDHATDPADEPTGRDTPLDADTTAEARTTVGGS